MNKNWANFGELTIQGKKLTLDYLHSNCPKWITLPSANLESYSCLLNKNLQVGFLALFLSQYHLMTLFRLLIEARQKIQEYEWFLTQIHDECQLWIQIRTLSIVFKLYLGLTCLWFCSIPSALNGVKNFVKSYQAYWDLFTLWILNIPVDCEDRC